MLRWSAILMSCFAISACSVEARHYLLAIPTVELATASGEVRPLEVRQGRLHLEATCDLETDAVCVSAFATWCRDDPLIYDEQNFQDSADSAQRTVWLAHCQPRDGAVATAG